VGITAYNEEKNITNAIKTLQREHKVPLVNIEKILVVSSGSTDRTNEKVLELMKTDPRIELIKEETREGKSSALNKILPIANGGDRILVLMSADVEPCEGCFQHLLEPFKDVKIGAVSCHPVPVNHLWSISELIGRMVWRLHHLVLLYERKLGSISQLSGELLAFRPGIVKKIPPHMINDDAFIAHEIIKAGYRLEYAEKAEVKIRTPSTIRELFNQRRRIATGHYQIEKLFSRRSSTFKIGNSLSSYFKSIIDGNGKSLKEEYLLTLGMVFGSVVEGLARILGKVDFNQKRLPIKWSMANSTKDLKKK